MTQAKKRTAAQTKKDPKTTAKAETPNGKKNVRLKLNIEEVEGLVGGADCRPKVPDC